MSSFLKSLFSHSGSKKNTDLPHYEEEGCSFESSAVRSSGSFISQRDFLRLARCRLGLYKRFSEKESPVPEKTEEGAAAFYARKLFPGIVELNSFNEEEAYQKTPAALEKENVTLAGAVFKVCGVRFRPEILEKKSDSLVLYYSTSSIKGKRKPLREAALHENLLQRAGLGFSVEKIVLLRLNGSYIRSGELDLERLFYHENLQALIRKNELCSWVQKRLDEFTLLKGELNTPVAEMTECCFSPSRCAYFQGCWGPLPENPVYEISGLTLSEKIEMLRRGDLSQEVIQYEDYPALTKEQKIQIESTRQNKPWVDFKQVENFLGKVSWPVAYLDFECIRPSVPLYSGMRPGQYIPFQYSLHLRQKPGGRVEHKNYLAEAGFDPRREFAARLIEDAGEAGTIFVYGKDFELARIAELSHCFPEYALALNAIAGRVVDLAEPFKKKSYYSPAMKGSYSIKTMIPALVSELSYEVLEIKNGLEAMRAFNALLKSEAGENVQKLRAALVEYCRMDTLALVKLHDILAESVA